jgi:hypothetical protein
VQCGLADCRVAGASVPQRASGVHSQTPRPPLGRRHAGSGFAGATGVARVPRPTDVGRRSARACPTGTEGWSARTHSPAAKGSMAPARPPPGLAQPPGAGGRSAVALRRSAPARFPPAVALRRSAPARFPPAVALRQSAPARFRPASARPQPALTRPPGARGRSALADRASAGERWAPARFPRPRSALTCPAGAGRGPAFACPIRAAGRGRGLAGDPAGVDQCVVTAHEGADHVGGATRTS